MSINIPDKLYQVFVLIGFVMICYASYKIDRIVEKDIERVMEKNFLSQIENFNKNIDIPLYSDSLSRIDGIFLERSENNAKYYNHIREGGLLFFFSGLVIWLIFDYYPDKRKKIKQTEKIYKYCQSCAKKFSSIRLYGTNRDLSQNYGFCEDCYEKGKFSNPSLTQEKVRAETKKFVKNKRWLIRNKLKFRIDNLERWKSDDYT